MFKTDIDTIDRKLLDHLQEHGRASNLELAAVTRLSPAQCHRRHRRLESAGFIVRYETRLNPETLGLSVIAFVSVTMEKTHAQDLEKFRQAVSDLPHVLECYSVTGDYDYVLKVAADDLKSLSHFLMEKLMRVSGVGSVRSSVCLNEIKSTAVLPLP